MSNTCSGLFDEPLASYSESVAKELRGGHPTLGGRCGHTVAPSSDRSLPRHDHLSPQSPPVALKTVGRQPPGQSQERERLFGVSLCKPMLATETKKHETIPPPLTGSTPSSSTTKDDAFADRRHGERVQPDRQVLLPARGPTGRA